MYQIAITITMFLLFALGQECMKDNHYNSSAFALVIIIYQFEWLNLYKHDLKH